MPYPPGRTPEEGSNPVSEGEEEEMRLALEEALEALIDLGEDDPESALQMYATLPEEVRALPPFRFELAALLREKEDLEAARDVLKELLDRNPDDSDAHHLLGDVLEDLDEEKEAAAHFQRTLELDREELLALEASERTRIEKLIREAAERVLQDLPAPLTPLVAELTLECSALPSVEQVEAGLDPRAACHHEGPGDGEEGTGTLKLFFYNLQSDPEDAELEERIAANIIVELASQFELTEEELLLCGLTP